MKALILAAGFGVRLREMIHGRPKPMAPIKGKPFLEYLILHLKEKNISDIVLAVGYLSDYIVSYFGKGKKWDVNISYSIDNRPLGTAGTIKYAMNYFNEDFLVLNGDTYIDTDLDKFVSFHKANKADATIAVTREFHGRGGLIEVNKNNKILQFKEIVNSQKQKGYNNAGMYVFNPKIFSYLIKGERTSLEKDLFPLLIKKEHNLYAYPINKYYDIGSPEFYQKAAKVLPKMEAK
ncbi:NDP-sugar synthase [Patescibacteria group bacterium]